MCFMHHYSRAFIYSFSFTAGHILQAMGNIKSVLRTLSSVQELHCKMVHLKIQLLSNASVVLPKKSLYVTSFMEGDVSVFSNCFLLGCTSGRLYAD